jgi:cysteine desulfurase
MRSGTESVPLIAAFAAAVDSLSDKMKENTAHYERLRAGLLEKLREDEGISFNSDENCVPYIVNFSVRGIRSEIMLHRLEESGIYVSSGSACSKGAKSGVLGEFGASREEEDSALRLSFSPETTEADIEYFVKALRAAAASIRR